MLKAISLWRSSLTLKSLQTPINPSLIQHPSSCFFSNSPVLHRRHHKDSDFNNGDDELNTDPDGPPRIFVVQPRLRPDSFLKAKLHEALNLANSLDEQRDGFYDTEFLAKEMPPHLVVQNPTARAPRAGGSLIQFWFSWMVFYLLLLILLLFFCPCAYVIPVCFRKGLMFYSRLLGTIRNEHYSV